MRREELCDPGLCPDSPDDGGRCDHCPHDRLDAAQASEKGLVIRRALDLMCALKLGVRISLDDIRADELAAMLIIAEERLRGRGIDPAAKVEQFELLLRLNHMSTQSSRSEIIAHRVTP